MKVPDSVLSAYADVAERMHGSAGRDVGDEVAAPDSCDRVGACPRGDVLRCRDGWGSYWFVDPPRGGAEYVCCSMPDVMAVDFENKKIGDKIQSHPDVAAGPDRKRMSMHYEAWDRAVVEALGGEMSTDAEKATWSVEKVAELPDSSFAYVEPGGAKDAVGKTAPRVLRHLPYKTAAGDVDLDLLAAALNAVPDTNLPRATQAKVASRLESVAVRYAEREGVEKYITHDGSSWSVRASSGRILGSHGSKAEAEAQLAAVEAAKHDAEKSVGARVEKSTSAVRSAFVDLARSELGLPAAALDAAEAEVVKTDGGRTVWKVACAGRDHYFLESGGAAAHLPMYAELEKSRFVPVVKSGEEQRYTLGVVYHASPSGADAPDFHGDIMRSEELERSAWSFMGKGNDSVGLMHKSGTKGSGRVVESYIHRAPPWSLRDVGGGEQTVTPGSWMLGVVWDEDAWATIKAGDITGYSLQGNASKHKIESGEA